MMKRNTIQRSLILEAVNRLQCHATAEEIYNEITREHPNIGRGTVYRNLKQLSEGGEIRKLEVPGGADRYDHRCHDHYHARCLGCGRVLRYPDSAQVVATLQRQSYTSEHTSRSHR